MNPAAADATSIKIEYTPIIMQSLPDISSTCFLSVEIYRLFTPVSAGYFLRNLGSLCIKKAAQSILCGLLSYITLSFASLELVHSGASLYQSIAPTVSAKSKVSAPTVIVHSAAVAYSVVFVQTHGYASPDFPEFAFLPTLFCFCNKKESIAIVN